MKRLRMNVGRGPLSDLEREFKFGFDLSSYERALENLKYVSAFKPAPNSSTALVFALFAGSIPLSYIQSMLKGDVVVPPHGVELLNPLPIPQLPNPPVSPYPPPPPEPRSFLGRALRLMAKRPPPPPKSQTDNIELAARLERKRKQLHAEFEQQFKKDSAQLGSLHEACKSNDLRAIRFLMSLSHVRHPLPAPLQLSFETDLDPTARIALCTIQIPDFATLKIVKEGRRGQLEVSAAERRRATETILYSLCIRAAYLVSKSDFRNWFDTVAVNAEQSWFDAATGTPRTGIIASLQANKTEILQLNLEQADPKACFRHLKGIATPSVEQVTAIRPIFVLNKDDQRIVKEKDVAGSLDSEANLAAMPWDDFEHLVRQLFEWEFGRNGVEVKVTRASRDRGVDAIMFDPDPLRGGKYVLQAKRYTRPVDVAAVRDLYGTVVNEGANRGILVTTSSYGPDAYDFAKDKPLSLVDGPNLIAMLQRHGRRYRIDLAEARRLAALDDSRSPGGQSY
jgi:restriction system protein